MSANITERIILNAVATFDFSCFLLSARWEDLGRVQEKGSPLARSVISPKREGKQHPYELRDTQIKKSCEPTWHNDHIFTEAFARAFQPRYIPPIFKCLTQNRRAQVDQTMAMIDVLSLSTRHEDSNCKSPLFHDTCVRHSTLNARCCLLCA